MGDEALSGGGEQIQDIYKARYVANGEQFARTVLERAKKLHWSEDTIRGIERQVKTLPDEYAGRYDKNEKVADRAVTEIRRFIDEVLESEKVKSGSIILCNYRTFDVDNDKAVLKGDMVYQPIASLLKLDEEVWDQLGVLVGSKEFKLTTTSGNYRYFDAETDTPGLTRVIGVVKGNEQSSRNAIYEAYRYEKPEKEE
jgi:hypothetical protein